jgi:hypothetical protein
MRLRIRRRALSLAVTRAPLSAALCVWLLLGCGGHSGPPRHPVAEMSARATAKLGLIDLIVNDPARAERLRQVYLRMAALAHEFDLARAHSMLRAGSLAEQRSAQAEGDPAVLELLLAPPLAQSTSMFERYSALQLEARSLLSESEFDKLNRVR